MLYMALTFKFAQRESTINAPLRISACGDDGFRGEFSSSLYCDCQRRKLVGPQTIIADGDLRLIEACFPSSMSIRIKLSSF
jgi:hypothetical protein